MATICPKVVRASVMRITRLDACGAPVVGSSSTVVSNGFIQVASSPQYESSDPIRITNANGELCINEPGKNNLAQVDNEIQFCGVLPNAFEIITGSPLVLDDTTPTPNTVGFRMECGPSNNKFALELWSQISGGSCSAGAASYWYSLFPLVESAQWGDFTFANDAVNFTITGSAFCGSPWGTGPYNVINTGVTPTPAHLLTAIGANDVYHGQVTTLAPPASSCGVAALP